MKKILAVLCMVVLAGCSHTGTTPVQPVITTPAPIIIDIPENYLECEVVQHFPDPDLLTNEELGELIVRLDTLNRECFANMGAIKTHRLRVLAEYAQRYGNAAAAL